MPGDRHLPDAPNPFRHDRRVAIGHLFCALAAGLALGPVQAAAPVNRKVVLSITGQAGKVRGQGGVDFDMAALAALPQHSFSTQTPWYKSAKKFTGPLLRDVLAAAGAQGETLVAIALNDYKVEIPMEDVRRFDVLLARLMDDQPMPTRDKGPLFIIYPFDRSEELRSERYYGRSAWQLRRIEVK